MGLLNTIKALSNSIKSSVNDLDKEAHCGGKLVEEEFLVVGINYCLENLRKLACANPDWKKNGKSIISEGMAGKKIFRYNYIYKPVKLLPEPKNPHDKNAVIVQIAGEKVGYISTDDNVHVKKILAADRVKFISAFISGGAYKIVFENGEIEKDEKAFFINVKIGYSK